MSLIFRNPNRQPFLVRNTSPLTCITRDIMYRSYPTDLEKVYRPNQKCCPGLRCRYDLFLHLLYVFSPHLLHKRKSPSPVVTVVRVKGVLDSVEGDLSPPFLYVKLMVRSFVKPSTYYSGEPDPHRSKNKQMSTVELHKTKRLEETPKYRI